MKAKRRDKIKRFAEQLNAAGFSSLKLIDALACAIFHHETDAGQAHEEYGTPNAGRRIDACMRYARHVYFQRGDFGVVAALVRRGYKTIDKIKWLLG